jgi:uncharacterized membrane protein
LRPRPLKLQREYLIEIGDAVMAVKTDDDDVELNQFVNTIATGVATGSFWGPFAGLFFLKRY